MRGRRQARRNELAVMISGAWHTAAFMFRRTPGKAKLPDLDRIVRRVMGKPRREQTVEEQLLIVQALNAKFGGKVIRGPQGG